MKATKATETQGVKKRAPTLYVIVAIKLGKGVLLLLLALGVYALSDNNLPGQFAQVLRFLHLDPEKRFFSELAQSIGRISPSSLVWLAGGTALYSSFSLVEGFGLLLRFGWAGWMAIGESVFFIPIEIYDLLQRYSLSVTIILGINIMICWYLFQNRHRLFRHHRHQ